MGGIESDQHPPLQMIELRYEEMDFDSTRLVHIETMAILSMETDVIQYAQLKLDGLDLEARIRRKILAKKFVETGSNLIAKLHIVMMEILSMVMDETTIVLLKFDMVELVDHQLQLMFEVMCEEVQ